jgi:hypothetical protein
MSTGAAGWLSTLEPDTALWKWSATRPQLHVFKKVVGIAITFEKMDDSRFGQE